MRDDEPREHVDPLDRTESYEVVVPYEPSQRQPRRRVVVSPLRPSQLRPRAGSERRREILAQRETSGESAVVVSVVGDQP